MRIAIPGLLLVGALFATGCTGGSGEPVPEGAPVAVEPAATGAADTAENVDPTRAAVSAFIERCREVHANRDANALAGLFHFGDTPPMLVQTLTMRERLRFKRVLETVEFLDVYEPVPNSYDGADYVPNIEIVGTLHRVFAPQEGMAGEVYDAIGMHGGRCYFPGLEISAR